MSPEEFGAKLAQAVKNGLPQQCRVVKVMAVDPATWTATVTPVDSEAELHDVRLRASATGPEEGVLLVPKVGTTALLQLIGNDPDLAWLARMDDVERVVIRVAGGGYLEVVGGKLKLNGEDFAGLVKITPLVQKINVLEAAVNVLQVAMASHAHPVLMPNGLPFLAAPVTGPFPVVLPPLIVTQQLELENLNVSHG